MIHWVPKSVAIIYVSRKKRVTGSEWQLFYWEFSNFFSKVCQITEKIALKLLDLNFRGKYYDKEILIKNTKLSRSTEFTQHILYKTYYS